MRQAAIRIKPWLAAWKFLIPNPPSFFGVQMSFQALKQRALLVLSSLIHVHQKL
jgi:hypothetical protein